MKALSLSLKHPFSKSSSSTSTVVNGSHSKKKQRPPLATTPAHNGTSQDITTKNGGVTSVRTATPTPNKPPSSKSASSKPAANTATTTTTTKHTNHDLLLKGIGLYQFLHTLGNGKFSKVVLAKHRESSQLVAIKIIDKQAHDYRVMSRLVREIHLMELLDHPNIVKLYETFETCDSLFLVMEYVSGYNLDEYLQQRGGVLSETEARYLFRQLVQAVHVCHRNWVVHRDLKTPNIMISKEQRRKVRGKDGVEVEVPLLKLADFGLGNRFGLQRLRTICGSMLYYSPEIISNQKYYGPEVDCWCLGIALFRMTAGFEPFAHAHTVGELKRDVCSCNFPMPASLGPELQNTILKCLQVDRRRRMTVRHALHNDPWLTKNGELSCPLDTPTIYDDLIQTQQQEGGELTAKDKERRTRRQLMKALEQEQPRVKRTIIYHPINPSTYFTTVTLDPSSSSSSSLLASAKQSTSLEVPTTATETSNGSNTNNTSTTVHRYDRHTDNVDSYRSELLQCIRQKTNRLGMRSAEKWQKMMLVRPQLILNLKSTANTDDTSTSQQQQSAKSFSWSHMMQRMQDQVYYFHVDASSTSPAASTESSSASLPRHHPLHHPSDHEELVGGGNVGVGQDPAGVPSLTLSSITTSGSIDEPLDSSSSSCNHHAQPLPSSHQQQQKKQHSPHGEIATHYGNGQLEKECMELLKQTCQLMGMTYYQEGPRQLVCVLTLRDSPASPSSSHDRPTSTKQQQQQALQRRSSKHSSTSTQRSFTSSSTNRSHGSKRSSSYEELILGGGGTYPSNTSSSTRFALPLISHLTSSMTTSFFARSLSSAAKQQTSSASLDTTTTSGDADPLHNKKKDGVAVFTMTLETKPVSSQKQTAASHQQQQHRVVALRFSKRQGSSMVFKMAGGWITGVLGLDGKLSSSAN
ncbi:kinase-like domain-containing protein [Absidia repens]|uniref:Kinase-like domain-containing protein n=1 Tax=Absidia repens TaxID=90262 RepID=A0A1X2HYN6_9FUNG|nr:kinase-like domain-containing protein [Absidia repens]